MQAINFHTELPASQDVFPGSSHDKVARAIQGYIQSESPSKIIGLDGEFGSGKSSILNMLSAKLGEADADSRVWFFDCEQNYQGSTKSNFIELFTEQVLKSVDEGSEKAKTLRASRDRALGRMFEYRKKTTSHVSAWALALLASLFFSATSFREIFALGRSQGTLNLALLGVHLLSLASPGIVLGLAKYWHRNVDVRVGAELKIWSLLSLFKGSTDDFINEKIEVGKEVSPLDLKRTLLEQLQVVDDKHFVIILDNLDRLPKDSLRSVWSDLEIFIAVAGKATNLTVIVPFCSTKVAAYLKADGERDYDARDFIAKKFPVVFRTPPVITSGWKDGFRQLWGHTFSAVDQSIVERCAQLLQRHSPMENNLVTPRLQKKFLNDIATTALVVGDQISLLAIAAYLLLCKYAGHPLVEILRIDSGAVPVAEQNALAQKLIDETKALLTTVLGTQMDSGWQIQFLQIHYLTTSDIAIAELLDTPLAEAFANKDAKALVNLTGLFGFNDAMKRLLAQQPTLVSLLPTIATAHQGHEGPWIDSLLALLNVEKLELFGDVKSDLNDFYEAFGYCRNLGLDGRLIETHGLAVQKNLLRCLNAAFDVDLLEQARVEINEYDLYLHAQGMAFEPVALKRGEHLMHLLPLMAELKVIKSADFSLDDAALPSANLQLSTCTDHPLAPVPLPSGSVVPALEWVYGSRKLLNGVVGGIEAADGAMLASLCGTTEEEQGAVLGLALVKSIDSVVEAAVTTLLAGHPTPLVKAVAAVTYIRRAEPILLGQIEDLDEVFDSVEFRALARATLTSSRLFGVLPDEQVNGTIGRYLARMISTRDLGSLDCGWVSKHYGILVDGVEDFDLSEAELLRWLSMWDEPIEGKCRNILDADPRLIGSVMSYGDAALPLLRSAAMGYVTSEARTQDDWSEIISTGAKQYLAVIRAVGRDDCAVACSPAIVDALAQGFSDVAHGKPGVVWGSAQFDLVDALADILDAQQKGVIGIRLKALVNADGVEPKNLAVLLAKYGYMISDLQPSTPHEVGRIVLFLDHLSRYPETTQALAAFFDTRAEQIATYKYSKELKVAMGAAVAKLVDTTPELYRRFTKTRGFGKMIQALTRRATDAEKS